MSLRFTIQELTEYVEEIFPQIKDDFEILEISEQGSRVKLRVALKHLRPGKDKNTDEYQFKHLLPRPKFRDTRQ